MLLVMAAFADWSWYAARTCCSSASPAARPPIAVHPRLKRQLPRLLGIAVPGVLSLRVALLAPSSPAPGRLLIFAAALGGIAAAVGLYMVKRRELARLPHLSLLAEPEARERRNLGHWSELPATTRRLFFGLVGANAVFLLLFMFTPVWRMGAPAILLLGLGLTAAVGSALVYMANHYSVPIITLMLLWLALCSFNNDNHAVRRASGERSHGWFSRAAAPAGGPAASSPLAAQDVEQYFAGWWRDLLQREPASDRPVPVFIVAAEGGGIRAAYWSASVLAALEDATAGSPAPFRATCSRSAASPAGAWAARPSPQWPPTARQAHPARPARS
jgi:hypothetical protein